MGIICCSSWRLDRASPWPQVYRYTILTLYVKDVKETISLVWWMTCQRVKSSRISYCRDLMKQSNYTRSAKHKNEYNIFQITGNRLNLYLCAEDGIQKVILNFFFTKIRRWLVNLSHFKGTQEWEFFWLRFWILSYFIVSYA